MTRTCTKHISYGIGGILCKDLGNVPTSTCTGCKLFELVHREPRKPTVADVSKATFDKDVEHPCVNLRSRRHCCEDMYICTVHGNCSLKPTASLDLQPCTTCNQYTPAQPIAPRRGEYFTAKPWEGSYPVKPWQYEVTVAIPCLDASEAVAAIVELYRLQTLRPFIVLIDTGSTPEELAKTQALAAHDVEVHSLRLNGVEHPSDFPAMAMDLAFTICRTPYLLATHADCFPMSEHVVETTYCLMREEVLDATGYEISPRDHSDWKGMLGHTYTMFWMRRMDELGVGWSLRRLMRCYSHPDGKAATRAIQPATSPNWPDTELLMNYQLHRAGARIRLLGKENNSRRTLDSVIDHCRSVASATLYGNGSEYHTESSGWLADGIAKAKERAQQWAALRKQKPSKQGVNDV